MRVPKVPRRWDFCGYPPCGLCFDEVQPAPPPTEPDPYICLEVSPPQEEIRVDGLIAMTEELTGKEWAKTTEAERSTVKGIAEDLHNKALVEQVSGKPPPDQAANPDDDKWFEQQINAAGKDRRKQKEYEEKMNKPKSLDQMDWGASEEAKQVLEEAEGTNKDMLKKAAEEEKKKEQTTAEKAKRERQRVLQELYNRNNRW